MSAYLIPAISQLAPSAQVTLPGSKSIALRQLAMAALSDGVSELRGVPPCDDTEAMLDCIVQLGARFERSDGTIIVHGPIGLSGDVSLNVRMSGASTRLLIGMAALRSGQTHLDGHASLRARSNAPLLDVLAAHGCAVSSADGCLPATIKGPFTPPEVLTIDGSMSSQFVTALLLCSPLCTSRDEQTVRITGDLVSRPYVDITLNEMAKRGVTAKWVDPHTLSVTRGTYQPRPVDIEGDATAATYFAALATMHGGQIELTNLGAQTRQGDYAFLDLMERLGAQVDRRAERTRITGPAKLAALGEVDMTRMPDAALTLIAMAPLLPEPAKITGLSSLHHKECDRLECPATELAALGVETQTTHDSILVQPINRQQLKPHTLRTYHDHRMAMAFSLLGSFSGTLTVDDQKVVEKTYPAYWRDYAQVADLG